MLNTGTITRSLGGTVNFTLPTGTQSASNGITTRTLNDSSGIIGGFATVGSTDFAKNSTNSVGGNIVAYTDYTNTALGGTINDGSTTNARINSGTSGNITLDSTTTAVNTLLQSYTTAATVDTASKTLQTGSIMIGSGKQALTLGAAVNDGFLTAASSGGELFLINNSSNGALNVNAVVADNGSASSLTKAGAGLVLLSGANTYTGNTTVTAGTLKAGGASANSSGAFGHNSAVTMANAASTNLDITGYNTQIGSITGGGAAGGNVTLGAATLTVGGDNSSPAAYAGMISGTGAVTKMGTGTQIFSGANTYTGLTTVNAG